MNAATMNRRETASYRVGARSCVSIPKDALAT